MESKGLIIQAESANNKVQQRALFLYLAGEDVQEIFEILADTCAAADYAKAEKALNDYFISKVNSTYQNHVFRSMEQQDGETVAQFLTRLKQVVKVCDYGDQSHNQIRDQVVQRCKSHALRRKLLEKRENLTLALLLTTAAAYEAVQSQLANIECGQHTVNLIRDSRREAQQRKGKEPSKESKEACYRCGNVHEVLHNLNQSTVSSKLDLKWGYHQLELHPDSRSSTTFTTHCGLYRYKRLMFRICSALEVYQHVIQQTLQGCECVANISDDIIVHGSSTEEHNKRLQQVLEKLKEKNLTLNAEKCKFHVTQLVFVGLALTHKGIEPTEDKVPAIVDAREPQNASEVRSFLGLANYNARFIPDFAAVAEPLRRLTKKGVRFEFGHEPREAFTELKKRLSSADILGYFEKDAKTLIITYASPVGLGAVLIQEQHGVKRIISYASKSLSDVEKRNSQMESIADPLSRLS